jgi:two-component system, NtrC family, nitrogen regulation sensor histidine kinase NtrY
LKFANFKKVRHLIQGHLSSKLKGYLFIFLFFLCGSISALYFSGRPASPEKIALGITFNLNAELVRMEEEATRIRNEWQKDQRQFLDPAKGFSFFIISGGRIRQWSDNTFVPNPASVQGDFEIRLLKEGSSNYVARKWSIDATQSLIGVIFLSRKFNITNDYLHAQWNNQIFPAENIAVLDPDITVGIPVCWKGHCPFRIDFEPEAVRVRDAANAMSVIFIFCTIGAFLLITFEFLKTKFIPDLQFLFILAALIGIRMIMSSFNFPAALLPGDLFNPTVFASSTLNASLGDLLINEIFLFILCLFLFNNLFYFRSVQLLQSRQWTSRILSAASAFLLMLSMLFPFVVIQTLFNNSSIVLGISESLRFDLLRVAATVGVVIAGICAFLFSHSFIRILIGDGNKVRIGLSLLAGIVIFVIFNFVNDQLFVSSLLTGLLYIVVVYLLNLQRSLSRLSFTTFTYLFLTVFCISLNGAFAFYHFGQKKKIENQFRFARSFLIDRDYFGEYLLSDLSKKIVGDQFIKTRVATPFLSKDAVRQKIRQLFIPSYFNKYDVEIFVFNSVGDVVEGRAGVELQALLDNYDHEPFRTDYDGIYFINSPDADVTQKYLVVVPVEKLKSVVGHVVIEFSLKKVIPENVYPEVLVDNRFLQFYRSSDISYCVYYNNELSYSSGNFNYQKFNRAWFGHPDLHTAGISRDGFDHIAEEDENGRIAVVSSKSPTLALKAANFSFLLVLGLSAILIFILVQGFISIRAGERLYFAARIQLFLNLAFFLPLIIVSVMVLRVTSRSSANQITEEYLDKTKRFSEKVSAELHSGITTMFEGTWNFENKLTDLAQLSSVEANVYTSSGLLFASSQPLIFENDLLSEFVNPSAYRKIRNGQNLFIETETVGSLEHFTAFASLKAPSSGALIGIVSIPFFQSVYSLEKVQLNILANILNIFAFIFIVLVALSYFITQSLTFPLTLITQTLRKTSLNRTNQPLVWKTDDEIGMMVKEYNQMLFSLSESKAELEQTQRERAWREIAQQVAHEIKNPLTPMKLTLQQLERSIQAGNSGPEKTQKAVTSLLTQVNTLNDIASSFSSFAKMPEPVMRQLEIISLLRRIVDLHSHSGDLRYETSTREAWVTGDEQLLGRTFSNIILNALQAARPGDPAIVWITAEAQYEKVLISFQDNGKGIEPDLAEQIFVPHFTTKKSGSGLGLAIAKQAMEQMKGRLWFETSPGKGTTFFIELPVTQNQG